MTEIRTCSECGRPLDIDAADGFCPACMLAGALELGLPGPQAAPEKPTAGGFADLEAGTRIGRYRLLEKIGEGGFGSVYMAEQETPVRRRVALKVIKIGMDTRQVVARFEAERQALALMDHPHVAKVFDAGATDAGRPYFVMELVQGARITDYCNQHQLPLRERLDLFIQICKAIQHAHQKGIIHRDLKPSNILVTIIDGTPVPKVIDFGIAKAASNQRLTDNSLFTAFDQFIGTPAYMSPEQAEMSGVDIDTRTDVYSLGVVLYELLAGRTPFDGDQIGGSGIDAIRKTIREKEPVRPSTKLSQTLVAADVRRLKSPSSVKPGTDEEIRASSRRLLRLKETIRLLRRDLDWVVMKCLEKDRNRRYETVNSLATDVQRHLNGEPVAARPPSASYKLQKLVRRNKLVFAAGAAIAAALIAGAVVSTWQAIRATNAQRAEKRNAEEAQSARRQAEGDLWKALLAEARALRLGGELGRKTRGLEAIAQAARIRTSRELVNEAIAHLALFDLKPGTNWTAPPRVRGRIAFDHAGERIVMPSPNGSVALWRMGDALPLREWRVPYQWAVPIRFSPNDQYFVAPENGTRRSMLIDPGRSEPLRQLDGFVAFSSDSRRYASVERDGAEVVVREIADGQPLLRLEPAKGRKFGAAGAAHPATNLLGVAEGNGVSLWRWDSPQRVGFFDYGGIVRAVALDGPWVAAAGTRNIRLWNRDGRLVREIAAHEGVTSELWFFPGGELIVSHAWDGNSRIWHSAHGTLVVGTQSGIARHVSPDGRRVGFVSYGTYGWWDVLAPQSRRELPPPVGASWCNFNQDGTLLATWDHRWVGLYDTKSGKALPGPTLADGNVADVNLADFLPDNRTLLVGGPRGLVSWAFERVDTSNGFTLRWGAPQPATRSETGPFGEVSPATLLANGTRVAMPGPDLKSVVLLPLSSTEPVIRFAGRNSPHSHTLSADGRWFATGTFHGQGPCIWDAQTGKLLHDLEADNSHVWFSPDGRVLLIGGTEWYRFLETGTWRELHRIPTGSGQGVPNRAAWSADGRLLAIMHRRRQVKLLDGRTWQPIADLTSPHESPLTNLEFSPDGRRLAICRPAGPVEIWDLSELMTALGGLGITVDLRQTR